MVDRYTKGALTAIALSLLIMAVQNAVGTSDAQQTPMKSKYATVFSIVCN